MSGKQPFLYDSFDLSTLCSINYSWPIMPTSDISIEEPSSVDGGIFLGQHLKTRRIPVMLRIDSRAVLEELATKLFKTKPIEIVFPHKPALTFYGLFTGNSVLDRLWNTGKAEGEIVCPDPFGYGGEQSETISEGATKTITIGGNYSAGVVLSATSAVRNSNNLWGVIADGKIKLAFSLPSTSPNEIHANSLTRISKVNGVTAIPTTDSDWLLLSPGQHSIKHSYGTGAATLLWRERWL